MDDLDQQLETAAQCAAQMTAAWVRTRSSMGIVNIEESYERLFKLVYKSLEDPEEENLS